MNIPTAPVFLCVHSLSNRTPASVGIRHCSACMLNAMNQCLLPVKRQVLCFYFHFSIFYFVLYFSLLISLRSSVSVYNETKDCQNIPGITSLQNVYFYRKYKIINDDTFIFLLTHFKLLSLDQNNNEIDLCIYDKNSSFHIMYYNTQNQKKNRKLARRLKETIAAASIWQNQFLKTGYSDYLCQCRSPNEQKHANNEMY